MAQRYDIIHIDFQANARNANAAIESMRQESERCNKQVKDLQKKLKDGIEANLPSGQIQKLRDNLDAATKQARQFNKAYGELAKGMRVLDQGIKAFNDGSLATMNAAFQKAVYNAAKLTRSRLDRTSASYKKDREEMTALMDATQQYYASIQTDTQKVLDTISKGGKVSRQALTEELQQQKELLNVLSEKDRGYKRTVEQVATLEYELKKMGGSYEFVRKHITDTKRVSSETLRTMYTELEQTNRAGKVSTSIMRENKQAMKEIRAEQERRVQKVLGGNLGRQSEGDIRQAIASAKELIQVYGTSSKQAQTLAAQIVNAESYLKTVGVEGARAARQQADAALQAADKYKLMQDRMSNITKLSRGAFTETQRFWQEQLDGSKRGSTAYKEAERNLKALANEQQRLNTLQLQKSAKQLERKNLGLLSEKELQASIAAAKQLAQSMKPGDQAYKDLVNNIMRAEKYVKEFGLEGQRSSRMAVEQMQAMNDRMSHLSKLSDGALEETRKFWQAQMDGAERGSKAYNTFKANMDAVIARQRKLVQTQNLASANKLMGGTKALQVMGEDEIRKAIAGAREYQKTLQADSNVYTSISKSIFTAEEYLKQYGIEADKAKLKEEQLKATMTSRMTTLMTLSDSALAETKKFWQSQMESAERTSDEYKQAAANLEKIAQVEQTHKASWGMRVMAKPENYGDAEIRQAVKAMEELRDAQAHGSKEWNHYNSLVEQGKKYLQEWAQVDSVVKFEGQMQKLTTLSDSALAETKKFWQGQVDSAAKGSNELKQYQVNLDKVKQEEAERRQLSNEMAVQKLGGNLGQLSESEIRQAIEAGKQLIQTYNTADPAAKKLAQQIVNAEQHLKQYGLEAERSAVREREAVKKAADERAKANQLMESQLQNSSSLTASALKAQESYWKRLIDDPKTAASSLSQYKANLDKVHLAQKLMMEDAGGKALSFFRNGTGDASAEEIRTQAEALKKYRDSLPQQTNADVIREINGYLAQTGQAAQGAAGPIMSLRDAFRMGLQGAANIFKGTPEQLKQAKQVLEETLATTEKGSHRYEQLRRALDGVALEEKRVGGVTKEMQAVLDAPKGRSFNELKMAVEQGRKALNDMSRTTKEGQKAYDELAEKVRNADLEMKNLGNESKGTTSAFEKAVSRLKNYITLYMGAAVAIQKISGAMGDMMTLSDKMGEVRKTTGFTADQVGRLSDNLAKLDTRTPIQDLMDMAAAAGQLGLHTEEDVRGFTEAANMLHVALPELGEEGATEMMKVALATGEVNKIRKQMEDGTVEGSSATAVAMEKIASTIDRLRATTAAAAQPVADFVKRVGAVGAQSGITVDQVAALGATVDELGMGTEMAATAISRMIPAIKNHAFDIARAIGVTPKTIRDLYDSGKAMDVILMILQHIHDQNLNPDGIEKLLGTGGMGEIMKELDQQGARAGIVFAGLSQNVGELRKNLGTAKEAYADNIAIQQEYDKMNDTTAARWERLKNQLQEFFVNDSSQRFFGGIISALRVLVNFITDDGPIGRALRYTVVYLAMLKAKWTEAIGSGIMYLGKLIFTTKASTVASTADATAKAFETTSTVALGNANATAAAKTNLFTTAWRRLNAAQKANVIAAVAMAVVFLTMTAIKYVRQLTSMTRAQKELNKVQDQAEVKAAEESGRLENLRKIVNDNTRSVKERKAAILEIQKAVPNYIATVNGEGKAYKRNTALLTAYINKLKEKALVEGAKEEMQSLGKEVAHTTVEITKQEKAIKDRSKEAAGAMQARPQTSQGTAAPVSVQARAAASMEILGMKSKLRSLQNKNREANDALQALQDSFGNQIAESDLANSLGKKGNGNGNDSGIGGGGGISGGGGGGTDKNNPWGANPDAASTNWSKMNGKDLVARRKQMNEFVLALQGDTDVESVLSEDPALMAAIKKGAVKKDADSVMAWYDKQRLAIQQVLHSRALSNTGNWQDPKQAHKRAKSISKLVKDDMAYYMDELDAYYTEQKSQIEDAQNSGEITEEEGWRRMLQNEQVYRQKRAELQQLYSKNSKEVTQQEADTIYEILADRTGDSVAFIKSNIGTTVNLIKQVGDKSAPAMRKIYGDLDKGVEQDFLKMRAAVKKQLDAIEEIVSKERPFDGIVKNLRQNVEKMGLLYTDLDKRKEKILLSGKGYGSDEMQNLNAEYGTQRNPRLTFLLQQSEDAYQMTWERLVNNMRVSGFGDWADAILNNEHAEDMKEALLAQLRTVYDTVQDAIKREASEVKKQVEITWNDTTVVGDISMKQLYEKASSALGMEQSSVSRANSLINAGPASGRVADRLAIKQMQIQLNMQDHYYALVRKTGQQRIDDLERQAKLKEEQGEMDKAEQLRLDAKHAKMSLNLTLSEEEADLAKQRADLAAKAEESENRLYTSLREWGSLLSSSAKSVFEASVTGEADYYNSLAKMRLTGEGSAGGTYIITEHAGTKEAVSHYESLDGEDALKRQLEIEQKNATADAWKKVMDDVNSKINEQITDWMNAAMQNQAVDNNTSALIANTEALYATRPVESNDFTNLERNLEGMAVDALGNIVYPINPVSPDDVENPYQDENNPSTWQRASRKRAGLPVNENPFDNTQANSAKEPDDQWQSPWPDETQDGWNGKSWSMGTSDEQVQNITEQSQQIADAQIAASNGSAKVQIANNNKIIASTKSVNKANEEGTRSAFAKMTQAANLYGTAYQAMSNNNLSTSQKFQMFAVQAAGQAAITMLTTDLFQQQAKQTVQMPGILGKLLGEMPYPAAIATYAAVTALMGGLMALAVSQASKSKSQIAQATGANVSAGRLSTGMLTYAEGNVNEFTNPSSLTPGQRYNVDAADGKTYRARYMGANPTTHLTNGPEFHLVGERGREAIIDANTTRRLQMNDTGIWQAIQTLYNGGRVRATRQRGGGMSNFADGNLDEFADGASAQGSAGSAQPAFTDMLAAIQASLDRNSEVMEKAVRNGIKGVFNVYGKGGIIDSYDTGKKNVGRYGEKY
nr:MAG TPA: tail tape measure protein [Caudoviricetes sp.]